MKNLALLIVFIDMMSLDIQATKFEFQIAADLPNVEIKVETENKRSEARKLSTKTIDPIIDVKGGDAIAVLSIKKECPEKKIYCEELDEIYIAYQKPVELKSRETNKSERGTYLEKIRRYSEPSFRGKTKFHIGKGLGIAGFFSVDALD